MTTKVIRSLMRLAFDYLEELAYWLDPAHVDIENARNRLERLRGVLGKLQTMTNEPMQEQQQKKKRTSTQ